jgi:hypothetical protein
MTKLAVGVGGLTHRKVSSMAAAVAAAVGSMAGQEAERQALIAAIPAGLTLDGHLDAQCERLLAEVDKQVAALVARLRGEAAVGRGAILAQLAAQAQAAPGGKPGSHLTSAAAALPGEEAQAAAGEGPMHVAAAQLVATTGPYEGEWPWKWWYACVWWRPSQITNRRCLSLSFMCAA